MRRLYSQASTVVTCLSFVCCVGAWPTMSSEDFSYEEVQIWKVDALKTYCGRQSLKVTGRKAALVARVFAASGIAIQPAK